MSRRFTVLALAPLLACAATVPAHAGTTTRSSTHIVAQKSTKKGASSVYLSHGLISGHRYRIEFLSSGHYTVGGTGFQNYTYVSHKQLVQGMKPFSISGKTPFSRVVTPPVSATLGGWSLTVQATVLGKHPLTVRYRDLGKIK